MYKMVGTFCKRCKPKVHIIMCPIHTIQEVGYHSGIFIIFWQYINVCRFCPDLKQFMTHNKKYKGLQ